MTEPNVGNQKRDSWIAGLGVAIFLNSLYCYTAAPTVPLGHDSGELISCCAILGVPHSPGYPLFTALGHLVHTYIPYGDPAWRQNIFNALCVGSGTGLLAAGLTLRLGLLAGVVSSLLFGLSTFVWRQAVGAEVFGLHLLLLCCLVWLALLWEGSSDRSRRHILIWTSFVLGCSFAHHPIIALAGPPFILYGFMAKGKGRHWGFSIWNLPVLLATWWLPYCLQIMVAKSKPAINWADPSSVKACVDHFLRKTYGSFSLNVSSGDNDERAGKAHISGFYVALMRSQFPLPEPILILFGVDAVFMRRQLARGVLFGGIALLYGPIFAILGNQPVQEFFMDLLERFYSSSLVGMAGLAALGISSIQSILKGVHRKIFAVVVASLPLLSLSVNWERSSQRGQAQGYDQVACQMAGMPPNAMYLILGDLNCGVANYISLVEKKYPKAKVILPGLVVSDWYTRSIDPALGKVAEETPGAHEDKINAMMSYCHEHNIPVVANYWQPELKGEVVDLGLYYLIVKDASHRPPHDEYIKMLQKTFDHMEAWPKRGMMRRSYLKNFWHNYFIDEWARCYENLAGQIQQDDPQRARLALTRVLEMKDHPDVKHWLNHGILSLHLKDPETALRDGRQVLATEPDNIYATALIVDALVAKGDIDLARKWQDRLLKLNERPKPR